MQPASWTSSPEVFPSTADLSTRVTRAARRGELRRVHGRIYTTNLRDPLEEVVRRHRWRVAGLLFPGAVVSHRSALPGDDPEETLFLTGSYDRIVQLPGLRLRQMAGPGPLPGDRPLEGSLFHASPARALLECLLVERVRGTGSPSLPLPLLHGRLQALLDGGTSARELLEQARRLVQPLRAHPALERLMLLLAERVEPETVLAVGGAPAAGSTASSGVGEIGTRAALPRPSAPTAGSRARPPAVAWDPEAIGDLEALREVLTGWSTPPRPDMVRSGAQWTNLAFLDAWTSCALDGRVFQPPEVERAIFQRRVAPGREGDAAVLLGTWRLLSSPVEMTFSARDRSAEGFITQLHRHHRGIFPRSATPEGGEDRKEVGEGSPEEDRGVPADRLHASLIRGYHLYRTLGEPLQRATFLLALVTRLRPFREGTGVVARATMNAELIAAGERRILFAPAPRAPYLPALDRFRKEGDPESLLRLMVEAQDRSAALDVRNRLRAAAEVASWGSQPRRRASRFLPFRSQ